MDQCSNLKFYKTFLKILTPSMEAIFLSRLSSWFPLSQRYLRVELSGARASTEIVVSPQSCRYRPKCETFELEKVMSICYYVSIFREHHNTKFSVHTTWMCCLLDPGVVHHVLLCCPRKLLLKCSELGKTAHLVQLKHTYCQTNCPTVIKSQRTTSQKVKY